MTDDGLRELLAGPALQARVPVATYRLQFNRAFPFTEATRLVPYLATLGASDVYAVSPELLTSWISHTSIGPLGSDRSPRSS